MTAPPGDGFWALVDATVGKDEEAQTEALQTALEKLSPEEVQAFDAAFHRASVAAYRWDLWGAAYVINGGCSDDGFMDFTSWLIAQGRPVYEAALRDPESLADHIHEDYAAFEEFAYVAAEVYMEKTGEDFPPRTNLYPPEPTGEPWQEDDVERLFPRLSAKVADLE